MQQKEIKKGEIIIYKTPKGPQLDVKLEKQTVWLTQVQISLLFDVQKAAISKHVKNIFDSGELAYKSTVSKMETVQKEGQRIIKRIIEYYNLDLVLSIGYRVNSKQATYFRKWATQILRAHIVDGFTINKQRIANNYDAFLDAIADVKALLPAESTIDNKSILELITLFADTWLSLDAYDKDAFITRGATKKAVKLTSDILIKAIGALKSSLVSKGAATDLFAIERERGSVAGIVGNVMQAFGGREAYPSVEEKAAHLLFFIVKNHPFVDGNKRSGAYAFVWFLRQAKTLDAARITPPALTAITLLVAESNPKDKDKMIKLILTLLAQSNK